MRLRSGVILASVVDVWENEPYIDLEQLNAAEIATPHIAGYSAEGRANGTAVCVRALSEFFTLEIAPNWYPSEILKPATSQIITIDVYGKSKQEIFYEAVTASYAISLDHIKILNSPEQFEKLRDDYSVRREFSFYYIRLIGGYEEISNNLEMLGFNVQYSK